MAFAEARDAKLYYEIINVVPPWVRRPQTILFHHGVSTNSGIWSDWIPVLCQQHRLVRFDMRGFGRSSVPSAGYPWSFDLLVEDAFAIADAAGASKFHLVGESIGGTAALAAAMKRPERVHSLTISNGAHCGHAIQNVGSIWRDRIDQSGQESWAKQMMEWRFFPEALPNEKWRWFFEQQATCSAEATLALAELLLKTDLSPGLASMQVPALLLSPDSSPFIAVGIMNELYAGLPDAEFQVFAHARHGMPLSHGYQCAAALAEFLQRRFAPAGAKC